MRPADPSDWLCPFDDYPAEVWHHWTGSGPDGRYFDPDLKGPLSLPQHRAEHHLWRFVGIADGACQNPTCLRLRRAGTHLVRLGEQHPGDVICLRAETVRQAGLMVGRVANELGLGDASELRWLSRLLIALGEQGGVGGIDPSAESVRAFGRVMQRTAEVICPHPRVR